VLIIVLKVAFVSVTVGIDVLSLALSDTIDIVAVVLIATGILSVSLASVVARRVAWLAAFRSELIWSSTLLFCHVFTFSNY
jgi:hypothetical protein